MTEDAMMRLIEPTMEYSEQIQAYRQEFLDNGDSMDGTGGLRNFDDPQEWIDFLVSHMDPKTIPEGRVPATQLIFVRDEDQKIVGMIDIRLANAARDMRQRKRKKRSRCAESLA